MYVSASPNAHSLLYCIKAKLFCISKLEMNLKYLCSRRGSVIWASLSHVNMSPQAGYITEKMESNVEQAYGFFTNLLWQEMFHVHCMTVLW